MIRKSIIFPEPQYQLLKMMAQDQEKKFSQVVRDLLNQALTTEEEARVRRISKALNNVKGICKDKSLRDVSSTINDTLYGEQGAWKG